jgi:hypothetical protein
MRVVLKLTLQEDAESSLQEIELATLERRESCAERGLGLTLQEAKALLAASSRPWRVRFRRSCSVSPVSSIPMGEAAAGPEHGHARCAAVQTVVGRAYKVYLVRYGPWASRTPVRDHVVLLS